MDTATAAGPTLPHVPWASPLRRGLAELADECIALTRQLDRELEPLHRLGEGVLARIAASATEGSAPTG